MFRNCSITAKKARSARVAKAMWKRLQHLNDGHLDDHQSTISPQLRRMNRIVESQRDDTLLRRPLDG